MSDAVFPYETRLNILHRPLEIIDIPRFSETIDFKWFNQTLCKVNDSVVRLGVIQGEYHKMEPQLVAIGGGGFSNGPENLLLEDYILSLANKPKPKVSFVPTASGDSEQYLLKFYIAFAKLHATAGHLPLFRLAVTDLRSYILAQDVIYVGGGNTRNMLLIWREFGLDRILREAREKGTVLCGSSAAARRTCSASRVKSAR